jgi:E3 ubiquitin-protein ligase UBR7
MDPPPPPPPQDALDGGLKRSSSSMSQASESSQTAADYISSQLQLEADAREALPYQFDTCTKPLGPLRQSVFACLTCTPPPASKYQQFTPAGVCYSCSISCHGEHTLVELFSKRDFVCDCGTTRLTNSATPCNLRLSSETGLKGGVRGEEPRQGNKYNQNFEGKFCGCGEEYDPEKEKGTMFQCLGLGTVEEGGCGEDWWHPECLMGVPRQQAQSKPKEETDGTLEPVKEEDEAGEHSMLENGTAEHADHIDEAPLPPGFPAEDDFDHLICYKCVDAFSWIKQYAGTPGFLPAVPSKPTEPVPDSKPQSTIDTTVQTNESNKRKAEEDVGDETQDLKRVKSDTEVNGSAESTAATNGHAPPKHESLPAAPTTSISLFLQDGFRDNFCRCAACFPRLSKHSQLQEEEEAYEPPMSESDGEHQDDARSAAGRSVHSGSLLERGEAALSSMDRVRAIEGVMAYNHVKDKVKAFLQPFAESGQAVGAEDIKAYFAKLRGDEQGAQAGDTGSSESVEGDQRKEQGGY